MKSPAEPATILIVDDLAANRKHLVTLLGARGYRMLEAPDGGRGLTIAAVERPDLVITDVLMPVMDGYEFVRQLRLDPAIRGIPVVFYTAHYGEREARELALAGGVSTVLIKPAESAEVVRVVEGLLSGESVTAPDPTHLQAGFNREHLRLLTDKLAEKAEDLRAANARLRALINIGLEVASEKDPDRLLERVATAARDLFGATYVTIGILHRHEGTVERFVTCGADAADWMKAGDHVSGILATVIAERRTMRGDNPSGRPAALELPPCHPEVHAYVAAPIASPARVYGWICLIGNEGRGFNPDDEDLVLALAGQVGRIYELEYEGLERKSVESALRHERDRAQQYLDTAEVILLALDLNGRVALVNRYACAILGWTEAELLGRDFVETCLPLRTRTALRGKFHQLVGGDLSVVENPVLTKNGSERLIEWRNTLVRDDAGHVLGTFSSGTDITERHHAVQELRTGEERMRFILKAAGVGTWDMDYATGVLQWSEIQQSQYGLPPGTFGRTFDAFIKCVHPDDRDAVLATIAKAQSDGADFSIMNRSIWPDGSVRWLSGAGRIHLDAHGTPVRGVGISLDVTERRMLEEQHEQARKMEAIGRLAGGVAHDFNNLLTVILGHCDLLQDGIEPDDPRQADIAEIQQAGERGAGLTRQLLAFSRKQIIEPTLLDLNLVVAGMRAMLDRLIEEDVEIVLTLSPRPALVKADRGQMEQIVMNFVVNARDAMPTGGTLTIGTANVEFDETYPTTHLAVQSGPHVVLSVTDTGTGMTPEVRAHLFEPFFTTKEPGKGTGLGLATVHGIVKQSGGIVDVHSEVGRGTSFKVYFPMAAVAAAVHAPLPVAPPARSEGAVLVVEDSHELRELARRLLERQGFTVVVASNADEALRLFDRETAIDVLLTDVVMPGASGPELTRQLLERRPTLKVIYMSGYAEQAIVQHGIVTPGIAFLHKPFTSETLGRKVHEALGR